MMYLRCVLVYHSLKNVYGMTRAPTYVDFRSHDINDLANCRLVTGHQPGMYFGVAIFTVLNFICFIVMCVDFCYTRIFVTTIQTAKQAGRAIKMGDLELLSSI